MAPEEPVISIPDDARELDRDVRALARERRRDRRRHRWRRVALGPGGGRAGGRAGGGGRNVGRENGPRIALILLLVVTLAGVATLPALLRPGDQLHPRSRPLGSPAVAAGLVGGLLPDGPVLTPAGWTTTRALARPSALLLVPTPCSDCEPLILSVVQQLAGRAAIRALGSGALDPTGDASAALRSGPHRSEIDSGVDVRDVLTTAYGVSDTGVTLVLVGPDGVVLDVEQGLSGGLDLARARGLLRDA